jgi:CheY-like chemotaxis protein
MTPTVLFADDELHNIEGLIETAKAEGYKVLTCRDASTAIQLTTSKHIDCLVIDIMMHPGASLADQDPQTAGLAAIDHILSKNPGQSIVCYTVISDPAVIAGLKRRGVLFLRKAETSADAAWRMIESKATGTYRHQ